MVRLVRRTMFLAVAGCVTVLLAPPSVAGLIFNMNSTGNSNADAGFQRAADFWSSTFDDDVEVNLTIGFASLGSGILGQAGSTRQVFTYSNFRTAIAADVSSADDATFSASLPGGSSFSVYINETSEATGSSNQNPYVDNDGGLNNTRVTMTRANAKALGLTAADAAGQDAAITFSSNFSWDFDPSDGIGSGLIDFVGVAIHEIGHAMGFISGVDVLDSFDDGVRSDNQFDDVAPLDFARFSPQSEAAGADIDWTADNRAKYYSIDGGTTPGAPNMNHWSRGVVNGDGRQASHWRDNLGLGIMDPTAAPAGSPMIVTDLDIQAFDIIGWDGFDAIPEPSSTALLLIGLIGVGRRIRRNRQNPKCGSLS